MSIKLKGPAGPEEPMIIITQGYSQIKAITSHLNALRQIFLCSMWSWVGGGRGLTKNNDHIYKVLFTPGKFSSEPWCFDGMRNYRPSWSRWESWTLKVQVLEPWKYLCIGCCSTSCVSTKVPDPCLIKHKLENTEGGEWWGNHTRHIGKDVEKLFGQKIRVKDERRKGCMYVLLFCDAGSANRMTVQKSL